MQVTPINTEQQGFKGKLLVKNLANNQVKHFTTLPKYDLALHSDVTSLSKAISGHSISQDYVVASRVNEYLDLLSEATGVDFKSVFKKPDLRSLCRFFVTPTSYKMIFPENFEVEHDIRP